MSVAFKQLNNAKIAVFANPGYVDTQKNSLGEAYTVTQMLRDQGHQASWFTNESGGGFAAALKGKDVLVMPEFENGPYTPGSGALSVMRDFVGKGGTLIVHGSETLDYYDEFLNTFFGETRFEGYADLTGEAFTRTADAAGTTFADDPLSLSGNNATVSLYGPNLAAHTLQVYAFGTATGVSVTGYGKGQVVFLGWDWYNAEPEGNQNNGWSKVLRSAVSKTDGKIVGTDNADQITEAMTLKGQALASKYAENIHGLGGDDYVSAAGGNDHVYGGKGGDNLYGGPGFDRLFGGRGGDFLSDDEGGARIYSGAGHDTFAIGTPDMTPTLFMDFLSGTDRIYIDRNEFDFLQTLPDNQTLPGTYFHKGSLASRDGNDRFIYAPDGRFYYDEDAKGGPDKPIHLVTLDDHPALKIGDIEYGNFG